MRKKLVHIAAATLVLCLAIPGGAVTVPRSAPEDLIQVGLYYGGNALVNANLENNTGYGAGYRFGYYDENLNFHELGRTQATQTKLTMIKTVNTWVSGTSYANSDNGGAVIGCYHIRLPEACVDFRQASEVAARYPGGFVAWVDGEYQARVGAYPTKEDAEAALAGLDGTGTIVGSSQYAVNVTVTGTTQILFQFDGGADLPLGILPDVTGDDQVRTWFKGYRYYGGFRYERINGGNLTVVNIVDMETYIKGVIPYEMSNSWPLEALKVQAVCARSYAYNNLLTHKHSGSHFDVCNTIDCQAYYGAGSNVTAYQANERTDRAVEETAGQYAWYGNQVIEAVYSSSHGGASESVANVWGSSLATYPYLCGVSDPYEQEIADKNAYSSWTVNYSSSELTQRLQRYGYGTGTTLSSLTVTYSELGNVIRLSANYANGQSNTFKPDSIRAVFGVPSIRFVVNDTMDPGSGTPQPPATELPVNGGDTIPPQDSYTLISGTGAVTDTEGDGLFTITDIGAIQALALPENTPSQGGQGDGSQLSGATVEVQGNQFAFQGSGYGHQLGMSQYGAYAMVNLGFSYDEILEFYYPGVTVK